MASYLTVCPSVLVLAYAIYTNDEAYALLSIITRKSKVCNMSPNSMVSCAARFNGILQDANMYVTINQLHLKNMGP